MRELHSGTQRFVLRRFLIELLLPAENRQQECKQANKKGAVSKWLKQVMRGSALFRNIFGQAKTECRKNGTQGIIFICCLRTASPQGIDAQASQGSVAPLTEQSDETFSVWKFFLLTENEAPQDARYSR